LTDIIIAEQDSIQQQTELRNSSSQQPHTFAILLNANPQTQKLQKNVAAPHKKTFKKNFF